VPPRHPTPDGYTEERRANPAQITPPHDGAVFWTNGDRDTAVRFAERETALGRPCTTLEGHRGSGAFGTPLGAAFDRDQLFDNSDPETRAFNMREAQRMHSVTGRISLAKDLGARRVWRGTSADFAARASGRVTVFTNDLPISSRSYFALYERDVLIRNEKVTEINGVPRAQLAEILDQRDRGEISRQAADAAINRRIEAGVPRVHEATFERSSPRWDTRADTSGRELAQTKFGRWGGRAMERGGPIAEDRFSPKK